jgi:hypothetical protein
MPRKRKQYPEPPVEINATDLQAEREAQTGNDRRRESKGREDIFAAGTAGGGLAAGGLAGTNIGDGDPDNADLDNAMGGGTFDTDGDDERRDPTKEVL